MKLWDDEPGIPPRKKRHWSQPWRPETDKGPPYPCRECGKPCTKQGGRCASCGAKATAAKRKQRQKGTPNVE